MINEVRETGGREMTPVAVKVTKDEGGKKKKTNSNSAILSRSQREAAETKAESR